MYKIFFFVIFSALAFLQCQSDKRRDIADFYYPAMQLREGLVYQYAVTTSNADTSVTVDDYWYFRGFLRDSGLFLAGTNYDSRFQIGQISREKITPTGSLIRDYFLYEMDTVTGKVAQVPTHIEGTSVFPFKVSDSTGIFLFSLDYHPFTDPISKIYIIRNRRFLGDGPAFEWQGKQLPTIRMGIREVVGNEQEGSSEVTIQGEEWYAKGVGLVYMRKTIGEKNQIRREVRLRQTYPMDELVRRAEQVLKRSWPAE